MDLMKQEIIQEQITRVLLERLIVNRPHPWGLLITFIELIKVRALSPLFDCSNFSLLIIRVIFLTCLFIIILIFPKYKQKLQNPRYNFWNRAFIRCAPEIEKLFESVSRSCGGSKPVDESMVSGWVSDNPH